LQDQFLLLALQGQWSLVLSQVPEAAYQLLAALLRVQGEFQQRAEEQPYSFLIRLLIVFYLQGLTCQLLA
jgi:hypothetical protein